MVGMEERATLLGPERIWYTGAQMRIRSKIALLTGGIFLGALLITALSIWTMNLTARLRDTIDSGNRLLSTANRLHGLMKDLMFDLFTPQTYQILKDVLHTPRFQTTRAEFRTAVVDFEAATTRFMASPRVKALLREPELRDAYATARTMLAKASQRIDSFDSTIDKLNASGSLGAEGLYRALQTASDPSIPLFFAEVRETSYYLTYSFESFLSHFIRSLTEESDLIQRQILLVFWSLTALIGVATLSFSFAFARRISARIKAVEQGFRRVSGGDFTARLDVASSDELGVLAANFNVFLPDLKRNIDSIQNLMRDVGKSITDRASLDRILLIIVEAAVKDSHASGAAVIVEGPEGETMVARTAGDFPFRSAEALPAAPCGTPQEAIALDRVLAAREPVFIREPCALGPAITAGSFIALPLVVSQRTVGMLCITTGAGSTPLTDLDYTNFSTFAEHAGLIIDNHYKYQEILAKREAEYHALQSQIQPHFLYNVLGGLIGLNRMGDGYGVERAVLSLKEMLRYILDAGDWTTIREEFRFLEQYCGLQQMRFADRLSVRFHLDPEAAEVRIPKLILQPVVENAVIHGIEPLDRPGTLSVDARVIRQDGASGVGITVSDDGIGIPANGKEAESGIGLANVRERLRIACPLSRIEVSGAPGQGTRVRIEIPEEQA